MRSTATLGGDYFDRRNKDTLARRMIKRLSSLGYAVTLTPAAPATA
ncbi:MAG: hypothetical protein HY332_12275 [Chloroflexi bacterium]|nr:hypothetical protein [Chloroflexota bacterium]